MLFEFAEHFVALSILADALFAADEVVQQPRSKHYDGQRKTGAQEDLPAGPPVEQDDAGIPDRLGNGQLRFASSLE